VESADDAAAKEAAVADTDNDAKEADGEAAAATSVEKTTGNDAELVSTATAETEAVEAGAASASTTTTTESASQQDVLAAVVAAAAAAAGGHKTGGGNTGSNILSHSTHTAKTPLPKEPCGRTQSEGDLLPGAGDDPGKRVREKK
jgi:hypothetical protein